METCPTCGSDLSPTGTRTWKGTLSPLESMSEMLSEIADTVVDQYTPPVSRK